MNVKILSIDLKPDSFFTTGDTYIQYEDKVALKVLINDKSLKQVNLLKVDLEGKQLQEALAAVRRYLQKFIGREYNLPDPEVNEFTAWTRGVKGNYKKYRRKEYKKPFSELRTYVIGTKRLKKLSTFYNQIKEELKEEHEEV